MASVSVTTSTHKTFIHPKSESLFKPLPLRHQNVQFSTKSRASRLQVKSSLKEKAVTGITAAALTASMVAPQVAEAAEYTITPSLNNFLLSIAAGGVVLAAIAVAVIGVSNFDPVKRA